jgi:hypothetical protein
MRVTIIPHDKLVVINKEGYSNIDLSSIDSSVHAVQWYDTEGEIEIKDARGRMIENRAITSFDDFAFVIPLWEAEKAKAEIIKAELEARIAQQNTILEANINEN